MLGPVPIGAPPQDPANHCQSLDPTKEPPCTVSVVLLPRQVLPAPLTDVAATEGWSTVTVTGVIADEHGDPGVP